MWNIVDWRTVDVLLDMGFRFRWEKRSQLAFLNVGEPRDKATEMRAGACLRTLLTRDPDADTRTHGREVVVSPLRPDHYGRARLRIYLPLKRTNSLYAALCHNYAGWDFLNVNTAMRLLADTQYDPSEAAKIVATSEVAPVPLEEEALV